MSGARCSPPFPARAVMLDASVVLRFYKCGVLPPPKGGIEWCSLLKGKIDLWMAGQVAKEIRKRPGSRSALESLDVQVKGVTLGSVEWEHFSRLRGGTSSNQDLGEVESVALCLAHGERGVTLPFLTCDIKAGQLARQQGVVVVDFLDTLAWLLSCGVLGEAEAEQLEEKAQARDGWRRPQGVTGELSALVAERQGRLLTALGLSPALPFHKSPHRAAPGPRRPQGPLTTPGMNGAAKAVLRALRERWRR